jgi:hypothetical protein
VRGVAEVRAPKPAGLERAALGDQPAQVRVVQRAVDEPALAPGSATGPGLVEHEVGLVEAGVLGVVGKSRDGGVGAGVGWMAVGHAPSVPAVEPAA